MIWAKTDAGRAEMQSRALVRERVRRNLLLLIDGTRDEATLRESVNGVADGDFAALELLGLIAPQTTGGSRAAAARAAAAASGATSSSVASSATTSPASGLPATRADAADDSASVGLDYAGFTATLTRLISQELGLRGFLLTLAVEKAGTTEELRAVAERAIAQIGERRGAESGERARRALFGGG